MLLYIVHIHKRMQLRELRWRKCLHLDGAMKFLPKMYVAFDQTDIWERQLHVVKLDLRRMPRMNEKNVIKLIQRHAATSPWHPYTQGHLYLIYVMGLVLRDERSLFWGYKYLCCTLHRYGPDTVYEARIVPDWVFASIDSFELDRDMLDTLVRFRWIYVMFGQTLSTPETICAVWDYILFDTHRIHCMCAAFLQYGVENIPNEAGCALEYVSLLISIQIDTTEAVADLIARAQSIQKLQS